jgi:hypothetical protein
MPFSTVLLGLLLIVSVLTTAYVFFAYRVKREMTREKFALRVFIMITSLASTLFTIMLNGHTALGGLIAAIERWFNLSSNAYEPGFSDKVLCIVVLLLLIIFALRLHRNWNGDISVREHEALISGLKPRVFSGALTAIAAYRGQTPLETYRPSSGRRGLDIPPSLPPSEAKAWHAWVARSLPLIHPQLRVDEIGSWYPDQSTLLARYGLQNAPTAILCVEQPPNDARIAQVIEFGGKEVGDLSRLIIAVNGAGERVSVNKFSIPVDLRYRSELLDALVDFGAYKNDIHHRYAVAEVAEGYALTLRDLYVRPSGKHTLSEDVIPINDIEEHIVSWVGEHSLRHIALLGEYGEGKSVLALRTTYRLLFEEPSLKRMPVLISLGGRSPRTQTKLALLAEWAAQYSINPMALLTLHEAGRLLLIFDAFDEMDLVGEAALRFDHFRTLWEFSRDLGAKILITGRPNFFLDQMEREPALNIRSESVETPFTDAIYISRFDLDKISQALRSFSAAIKDEIVTFLASAGAPESFRDLMSRPSTLFLSANIWQQISRTGDLSLIKSAEIIQKFIDHNYERQTAKTFNGFLSPIEREYFNAGIARGMYSKTRFSNHLNIVGLRKMVVALLDNFPNALREFESAQDRKQYPLKERIQDREILISTTVTDVHSCGILVSDLSQFGAFKFSHKSFFELLVATYAVEGVLYDRPAEKLDKLFLIYRAVRFALAQAETALSSGVRLNEEMAQFAGELLFAKVYRSDGGVVEEPDRRLNALGLRMSRLRIIARFVNKSNILWPLGMYLHLGLCARTSLNAYVILAYFFLIRGTGGNEFIKLINRPKGVFGRLARIGAEQSLSESIRESMRVG